ncbi:hypothetical protein ACFLR4_03765 [Bacteroidota bacterium]
MNLTIFDILGSFGVGLIIITYLLLQLDKIKSTQLCYSILNGLGSILIMISLIFDFNFSAFIIEFFWLIISLVGIVKYFVSKYVK